MLALPNNLTFVTQGAGYQVVITEVVFNNKWIDLGKKFLNVKFCIWKKYLEQVKCTLSAKCLLYSKKKHEINK